ncbi:MAG: class I SAM-dependent methyltransferase [Brevibacillus sp.]|nr:class I SAM-dependent methyltransferase [Brevibacillus sp.]
MNTARERNVQLWENLYSRGSGFLMYPNDVLVRIAHKLLSSEKHKKILDYGFGGGANYLHFCKRGFEVHGVEVSQSAINVLQEKLRELDIPGQLKFIEDGKIPYPDSFFDVVVAWQVLYYNDWDGLHFAVEEINRVLRAGGLFIGTMGAVGDCSQIHGIPLGDSLYKSTLPGQEGAIVLILEEEQLQRCFPKQSLTIGHFGHSYGDVSSRHWIITYEKGVY